MPCCGANYTEDLVRQEMTIEDLQKRPELWKEMDPNIAIKIVVNNGKAFYHRNLISFLLAEYYFAFFAAPAEQKEIVKDFLEKGLLARTKENNYLDAPSGAINFFSKFDSAHQDGDTLEWMITQNGAKYFKADQPGYYWLKKFLDYIKENNKDADQLFANHTVRGGTQTLLMAAAQKDMPDVFALLLNYNFNIAFKDPKTEENILHQLAKNNRDCPMTSNGPISESAAMFKALMESGKITPELAAAKTKNGESVLTLAAVYAPATLVQEVVAAAVKMSPEKADAFGPLNEMSVLIPIEDSMVSYGKCNAIHGAVSRAGPLGADAHTVLKALLTLPAGAGVDEAKNMKTANDGKNLMDIAKEQNSSDEVKVLLKANGFE